MPETIKFKGNPVTLVGRKIEIGGSAPEFTAVDNGLKPVRLSDFKNRIKIVTSFPSLDTSVCEFQVKEFEKWALSLSDDIVVLGISKDLPFAQKRFCGTNSIDRVRTLSDYNYSSFGINYGLLIKELNLLARAIIIIDKNNAVRFFHRTEDVTDTPDFDYWKKPLKDVAASPSIPVPRDLPRNCKPSGAELSLLPREAVETFLASRKDWNRIDDTIAKTWKFADFREAKYFADLVSVIAEEQDHHPDLTLSFNKLEISLTTHAAGGLTENDFIMAGLLDDLE
jgi:thiol peroxidase